MSFDKEKFKEFLKKRGLAIGLALCIAAIAVAAIFASAPAEPGIDVQKQESPRLSDELTATPAPTAAPSPTPSPSPSPSPTQSAYSAPARAEQTMTMPAQGEIIKAFSGDKLVYNATLNMWTTHNGIDISCEPQAQVCAALPGQVEAVETDSERGVCVRIAHSDGQATVYAGLASAEVKPGDRVNAGRTIGSAGTPAFEADSGAHLHFEYVVSGVYQDPAKKMGMGE